jgi:hypothetical protein
MATAQAMPSTGKIIRWGLQHVDVIRDIGDAAQRLPGLTLYVDRWNVCKPVGDKLAAAADDLFAPGVLADPSEDELKALELELLKKCNTGLMANSIRDGKWLGRAVKLVQVLLPILIEIGAG